MSRNMATIRLLPENFSLSPQKVPSQAAGVRRLGLVEKVVKNLGMLARQLVEYVRVEGSDDGVGLENMELFV